MSSIQPNLPTTQSTPPPSSTSKTKISLDAGGTIFTFARATFNQPHLKDSVFEVYTSKRWDPSEEVPYYDCDSQIFEHIASYIRYGVVPKWKDVENPKVVLAVADFFNLPTFAEEFKNSKNEMKISIEYGNTTVIDLKLNSKANTKTLIMKFVEKYNKNLVQKLTKEEIKISVYKEKEKRCTLELGMRLKNQKIENGKLFAYCVNGRDSKGDWETLEAREREAAAESTTPSGL